MLRLFIMPYGRRRTGPSDRTIRKCADILLEPCPSRDRLIENVYIGGEDEAVARLTDAFRKTIDTQPIHDRMKRARVRDPQVARERGLITDEELKRLRGADEAVAEVIAVDDFAPEELVHRTSTTSSAPGSDSNGL
jgi:acyl-CoA dehydrogenase